MTARSIPRTERKSKISRSLDPAGLLRPASTSGASSQLHSGVRGLLLLLWVQSGECRHLAGRGRRMKELSGRRVISRLLFLPLGGSRTKLTSISSTLQLEEPAECVLSAIGNVPAAEGGASPELVSGLERKLPLVLSSPLGA